MTYPDGIDALVNVNANDSLALGGHAARHNSVNTALGEVKDFLGTGTGYRYNSTVYFTSNGTFTKADYPWLRAIRVKVQGAGGGGGGCSATAVASTQASVGSGGAGGGFAERFYTDIGSLSASVTVTVGSGGAGGAAGVNNGSAGGISEFGGSGDAWRTRATGGGRGSGGTLLTGVTGWSDSSALDPGDGSDGELLLRGGYPKFGVVFGGAIPIPSCGGSSFLSGETKANLTGATAAGVGGLLGSGGSGANGCGAGTGGVAQAGGNGGSGIVIVELYA
jgi:hypothetical protein